jgi:signal transduction histidine kinase
VDNLISNAIKYSPHGKNVIVRIAVADAPHDEGQRKKLHTPRSAYRSTSSSVIRFEVRDEGPGLTDDDKLKLFGKFARLSAQPTGGEHSTGLGLSIVKKMVDAMDGSVYCESTLGKGSAFFVELPVADYEG